MGLYRRPDSPFWWYSFTVQGDRLRGCTETDDRATAEIVLAKRRHDALLGILTNRAPQLTLDDAAGRYLDTHASDLPSADDIDWHLRACLAELGKGTLLSRLTDDAVSTAIARWRATLSNASVNRRLTVLRACLRMARERWGVEVKMPNWKAHWLREPAPRDRHLTPEEAEKLIEAAPEHLRAPIRFSLLTGVRLANCVLLDWSRVRLRQREILFRVKSTAPGGKPLVVPIIEDVLVLLANLGPKDRGPVFTYACRRNRYDPKRGLRQVKGERYPLTLRGWYKDWKAAVKAAKLDDFHWHDLRHTAASWMVQAGQPLDVVQDVLGHEDIATTRRYAHRDTDAKRQALEAAASRLRHAEKSDGSEDVEAKGKVP